MAHKLTKSEIEYIKTYFKNRSNRQLAEDLNVDKSSVVHTLNSLGLTRTKDQDLRFKTEKSPHQTQSNLKEIPVTAKVSFRYHVIFLSALFFLVFMLYANTFHNQFVWDDEILVVQNNYIKSSYHIPDYFTENTFKGGDRDSNFWRPVQLFSYLVDFKLWGLNPFGFHLSNTLYHAIVCLLMYIFVFLLFQRQELSLISSLLYALHPIHTEAVTYIAGRADSQATVFILLSLCLYLRYTHSKGSKDILVYLGSFLSYILALMSKEMSLMLPAYFILVDIVTYQQQNRKSISNIVLRYLPMLVLLGIYLYMRSTILDFANIPLLRDQPAQKIPILLRFCTFTRSLSGVMINPSTRDFDFGYLWLLLVPFNLHMERGMPYAKSFFDLPYLISFLVFIGLIVSTIYFFKKSKPMFFGLAFFIVAIMPFADLLPLNANLAEHWLYVPSIGFFIFIAEICAIVFHIKTLHSIQDVLKKITFSPIIIYLVFCGVLTVIRNLDWKDELTIWESTARLSNSSHIHGNLGVAYGRKGNFQSAKNEFIKALRLQFNYPEAHNNLGVILLMEGNTKDAKSEFEYAIQFNPNYSNAYKNLGDVYAKLGNKDEAKKFWSQAVSINPYHDEAKKRLQES